MHIHCWNPKTFGGIISCLNLHTIGHPALIEHIECRDIETAIPIYIRYREQITTITYLESCFFLNLTNNSLLCRLVEINKSTWKVECSLCRFFATTTDKQFAFLVNNKCRSGRTGIHVVHESTVVTLAAFLVVLVEMLTSALRTKLKNFIKIHLLSIFITQRHRVTELTYGHK